MTPDDLEARLAAAVDEAIPPRLRKEFVEHLARQPVLVARQGIFSAQGRAFAYQLSFRSTGHPHEPTTWGPRQHERATAHVLGATFGRSDLETVAHGRLLFVRCPRAYLVGDLTIPRRPDRLVIEITDTPTVDARLIAGVRRLREQGFQVAIPAFYGSADQMRLLPHADFVKIDVRDLDVEGAPLVDAARSYGAMLIAEYVETPQMLREARRLGFTLFQGNLLEQAGVLDRTTARQLSWGA
ncbi:EAL domain-containing protein [Cellulomonas soli]|uniref:EAL domain-containing protein n=1 Tax=Cellulomonas soli TaxID=931535 RepID=UPI003F863326